MPLTDEIHGGCHAQAEVRLRKTVSLERSADMFAQLASMILRGVREFDEAARETASDNRSSGESVNENATGEGDAEQDSRHDN